MFGNFYFDSPFSSLLQTVNFSYKVFSTIKNGHMVSFACKSEISFNIPMHFLPPQSQLEENTFFENLSVTKDEVVPIEKETIKQASRNK